MCVHESFFFSHPQEHYDTSVLCWRESTTQYNPYRRCCLYILVWISKTRQKNASPPQFKFLRHDCKCYSSVPLLLLANRSARVNTTCMSRGDLEDGRRRRSSRERVRDWSKSEENVLNSFFWCTKSIHIASENYSWTTGVTWTISMMILLLSWAF